MALSIHYRLDFEGTDEQALEFVQRLRGAAVDFRAGEVTQLVASRGKEASNSNDVADDDSIHKMAASSWVMVGKDPHQVNAWCFTGFILFPGEGCEPVPIGLAQFPPNIEVNGSPIDTELGHGWHWISHVKTQYAGNPKYGGIQNFLQSHLTICALLERAKEFGATIYVVDDSGFWEHRSVAKLVKSVEQLNELMAGLVGALKDTGTGGAPRGAILEYPNFEHLEAKAMENTELANSLTRAVQEIQHAQRKNQ